MISVFTISSSSLTEFCIEYGEPLNDGRAWVVNLGEVILDYRLFSVGAILARLRKEALISAMLAFSIISAKLLVLPNF